MNKPYILCHMMASVDGRIDCAMTEQLPGVQEYYATLDALEAPTRVSGRVTAELEMARPGAFQSEHHTPLGRTAFSKAAEAEGYEVVADTHGTLLWDSVPEGERPGGGASSADPDLGAGEPGVSGLSGPQPHLVDRLRR